MMMSSKEDCGEALKAEIRALRKKYGGFAVDLMNKVCQIEDGDSGVDPEPDLDGEWNINWPDVKKLAALYTDHGYSHPYCHGFYNGESFNDDYQPDPTIFLWTINAVMTKPRKKDRPFGINATPNWAKILTSNLSERTLSKFSVHINCQSELDTIKIWAHESRVMFEMELDSETVEELDVRLLSDLILDNRVTKLTIDNSEMTTEHLLPTLETLRTMKNPALKFVKMFDEDEEGTPFNLMGILRSLSSLGYIRSLHLSIKSQSQTLDFFVDRFLSHPDCRVDDAGVWWETDDVTIESSPVPSGVTLLEADYLLKMVCNCPTIRRLNYYDPRIWRYESNVRQRMVSFFIALQQNQVGRGLVLDQSCYRTTSSHGIFSHLLDRAYNRLDPRNDDFDYIQYEEGVFHHHQDHPYDGIYFMIKELAGRGVLGIECDVGEDAKSCTAGPSKRCKR